MMNKQPLKNNFLPKDLDEIDKCKQKQLEICSKKIQMEQIIDDILKKSSDKSVNTLECLQIVEQLHLLKPLLQNVDATLKDVKEEKFVLFYQRFRNIFKKFEDSATYTNQLVDETFKNGQKIPKDKVQEIMNRIINMKNELANIQKGVFSQSKKYLVWLDYNMDNDESKVYLQEFERICNGVIKVVPFSSDQPFRDYISKEQEQMFYVIMSGKAAGNYPGDGQNLTWIKQFIKEKQGYNCIYGVYIFTSQIGYKYFEPLKKTEKDLVLDVTMDPNIIFQNITNIIFPKNNIRVIIFDQLNQFLTHKKDEFLNFSKSDFSHVSLQNFHPDKTFQIENEQQLVNSMIIKDYNNKNLLERLKIAKDMIKKYQLGIQESIIQPEEIYSNLKACYSSNQDTQIAQSILKLYTCETSYYQIINSILGVMNEELLTVLWDLILGLRVALSIFDDSADSQIKPNKENQVTLYRGASIPIELFESTYKADQYICMCGFSSFTSLEDRAQGFSKKNKGLFVVFKFVFNCGKEQYKIRPKFLESLTSFKGENEYLVNCASVFKIRSIYQKNEYTYVDLII